MSTKRISHIGVSSTDPVSKVTVVTVGGPKPSSHTRFGQRGVWYDTSTGVAIPGSSRWSIARMRREASY